MAGHPTTSKPVPWNVVPAWTSAKARHMLWSKNPTIVHAMLHPKPDYTSAIGAVVRDLSGWKHHYGTVSGVGPLWVDGSNLGGGTYGNSYGHIVGTGLRLNLNLGTADYYELPNWTNTVNHDKELTYITHFQMVTIPATGISILVSAQDTGGNQPAPYQIGITAAGTIRIFQGDTVSGNDYQDTSVVQVADGKHYVLVCSRGSASDANEYADWDVWMREYGGNGDYLHENLQLGANPTANLTSAVRFGRHPANDRPLKAVFFMNILFPKKINHTEAEFWMQDPYEPFRFAGLEGKSLLIPVSGTWNLPSEFAGQPTPTFNLPSEFTSPAVAATKNLPAEFLLSVDPAVKNLPSEFLSTTTSTTKNLPSEFLLNITTDANLPTEFIGNVSAEKKLECEFLLKIQTTFNFSWAPPLVYEWERARIHFAKMGLETRFHAVNVGPETRRHMGTMEGETRT